MSVTKKRYFYKIFAPYTVPFWDASTWDVSTWDNNPAPSYITTWTTDVVSEPSFRMVINGGAADMTIRLARPYNNYGEGVDVATNNRVECWMGDTESANAKLIYSGFISGYAPTLDGVSQYVDVTVMGYAAQMTSLFLQDNAGYTAVEYDSEDVASVIFDVIARYRSDGGMISVTPESVDYVGDTITYLFNFMNYKDVLDALLQLTPSNWYYFVDATNTLNFHQAKMDTANIIATVGKNVTKIEATKRIEQTYDRVYVLGGVRVASTQLFRRYDRSNQINNPNIGLRVTKINDSRVTDIHTADVMARRQLDMSQGIETRLVIGLTDDNGSDQALGIDLESIIPGQTIQVVNLNFGGKSQTQWDSAQWDTDVWDFPLTYSTQVPLLIVAVSYSPTYVEVECSSRLPEVARLTKALEKTLYRSMEGSAPILADVGGV